MKRTFRSVVSSILITATLIFPGAVNVYAAPQLTSVVGGREMLYATWSSDASAEDARVYYKPSEESTYIQVDAPLVRSADGGGRVDIPGLGAGNYDIRIETADGTVFSRTSIPVEAEDRSGYAHFKYSGVGAYNDDGTPKDNAAIIYVTNENKNSVAFDDYTGLGDILTNADRIDVPLIVRIIGTVDTQTRDSDGTKNTDIADGVIALEGLTDRISSGGDDSYFNMMDVKDAADITIEGIGDDAVIEKWGFTFSDSNSIEVKNLRFTRYPEDACSTARSNYVWIHSNTFDVGENKYDLTPEQDKGEGDGSTDINESEYVTLSYNRYNQSHKTSLHGGGDSQRQYNITWHHNYFNDVSSRMPLVRHANVHMYNNYFYSGTNCVDARASAWVFTENNYFEDCAYAFKTTENSSQGNPVIKSYKDTLVSSGMSDKTDTIFTADSRDQTYSVSSYKEDYANFDVNPDLFYYDEAAGTSDVTYLTSAQQAKEDCIRLSGVLVSENVIEGEEGSAGGDESSTTESTTVSSTESTTESTTETTTESTTETTTETTTESTTQPDGLDLTGGLKAGVDYGNIFVLEDMPYSENNQTIEGTEYAGSVSSQNNPGFEGGIPVSGCVIKLTPQADAEFTIAFKLNATKVFYLTDESGETLYSLEGGESSAYHRMSFDLEGGRTYYAYCQGSKMATYALSLTEEVSFLFGDADNSGLLTSNDAAMVLKKAMEPDFVTELDKVTQNSLQYIDIDGDGSVGANDAALVLSMVLDPTIGPAV